jgi:hypothetical protein
MLKNFISLFLPEVEHKNFRVVRMLMFVTTLALGIAMFVGAPYYFGKFKGDAVTVSMAVAGIGAILPVCFHARGLGSRREVLIGGIMTSSFLAAWFSFVLRLGGVAPARTVVVFVLAIAIVASMLYLQLNGERGAEPDLAWLTLLRRNRHSSQQ